MKLVETTVTETTIRLLLADNPDPALTASWIECQLPMASLKLGSGTAIGDPNIRRLALVHQAALHEARNAITAEIRRLEGLASSNPP